MKTMLQYQLLHLISTSFLGVLFGFALFYHEWPHVIFIGPLLVIQIIFSKNKTFPTTFFFLFPFIALLATLGGKHPFNLYERIEMYDKVVHLFTAFVVTYFISFLLQMTPIKLLKTDPLFLLIVITCYGITIGVAWEIFEWIHSFFSVINLNESIDDVITDLIIDAVGAVIAGLVVIRALKKD